MADLIANLEGMLTRGNDTAMVRFGLGKAYLDQGHSEQAAAHLRRAVEMQPDYSAAWKLLGKALAGAGQNASAIDAYTQGIAVAEARGDIQAAKEMKVFLKRLSR
jgi:Tfp pilus assembly protein PilF